MKVQQISVLSGFRVVATLRCGKVLRGVIEKEARRWWIGSDPLVPRKIKRIFVEGFTR